MERTFTQLNPKIKYLVDECVSLKCTGLTKRNAIKSSEIFPSGTPDDEILKFIQKHGLHLITADIRFALKTAMIEKKADYFTQEGERYRLRGDYRGSLPRRAQPPLNPFLRKDGKLEPLAPLQKSDAHPTRV